MKKLALVGAILLVVGLATSPARAVDSRQKDPEATARVQAFLATLAAPDVAPAPVPAAVDCAALFTQCENSCPGQCVKSFTCSPPYRCVCGHPCI